MTAWDEGLDPDRLARALNATVGTVGWVRATPSSPVEEWRENARMIAAEYRRLSAGGAEPHEPPHPDDDSPMERCCTMVGCGCRYVPAKRGAGHDHARAGCRITAPPGPMIALESATDGDVLLAYHVITGGNRAAPAGWTLVGAARLGPGTPKTAP